ncbi:MAG: acyl carrier protein [Myxococcaceae bacterium]|nr:acyl carrier protein [Myxococcaceae bacterium]
MTETELKTSLKALIVESLRLEDVKPESIKDEDPLFSPTEGLGLDSLSALELLSAIEYKYNVRFEGDGSAKEHFRSVATLAAYLLPKLKAVTAAA